MSGRPRPLPSFAEGLRTAATRARRGYLSFLPAILVTWVLVEVVAPASGKPLIVIGPGLFCLGLVGYAAAAAKTAGRTGENVVWLTLTRGSACLSYLGFLLILALVSVLVIGVGMAFGAGRDLLVLWVCIGVWAMLVLLVCSRLWPGVVVPFLYGGVTRYSASTRSMLWVGPGLPTAWRMTAAPGVLARVSAPYLLVASLSAGSWGCTRTFLAVPGFVRFALDAAFYSAIVPFLVTLADVLGDGLRVPTPWDDQIPPSRRSQVAMSPPRARLSSGASLRILAGEARAPRHFSGPRGAKPRTRPRRLTYINQRHGPGGTMSLLKRLIGKGNEAPKVRTRICVECGMPVAEHKDWCSILRGQIEMRARAAGQPEAG